MLSTIAAAAGLFVATAWVGGVGDDASGVQDDGIGRLRWFP
jgi:hypothetical protein